MCVSTPPCTEYFIALNVSKVHCRLLAHAATEAASLAGAEPHWCACMALITARHTGQEDMMSCAAQAAAGSWALAAQPAAPEKWKKSESPGCVFHVKTCIWYLASPNEGSSE